MVDIKALERGWLSVFLRSFEEGEAVTVALTPQELNSLRVTMTRLQEEDLLFETHVDGADVTIRRIDFKTWLLKPQRKII